MFKRKNSVHIFTTYVSKNEVFCCEVETHFERSPLAMFKRKNSVHIFTIYVSNKEVVCREVETDFGSYALARYTEKILGTFS